MTPNINTDIRTSHTVCVLNTVTVDIPVTTVTYSVNSNSCFSDPSLNIPTKIAATRCLNAQSIALELDMRRYLL